MSRARSATEKSVLGELCRVCDAISGRHADYPWERTEAALFVLAGVVPFVPAVKAFTDRRIVTGSYEPVIRLDVALWVPDDTVKDVCRAVQRVHRVEKNQQIEAKAIALFRFVTERISETGTHPRWVDLKREWNQAHPEWVYSDAGKLARDYKKTYTRILYPQLRAAGYPIFNFDQVLGVGW
jgi:hypothetical protein